MSESKFPWRTVLFISVALNLLAAGTAIGAYSAGVRVQREAPQAVVDRMPGPRAFMAALPEPTRTKMRTELADSWVASRQARQAATQARREAFAAAAVEPYDAARVGAAFARLRAADQAAIAVFQDDLVHAFGRLTPAERREALQALRTAAPARQRNIFPRDRAGDDAGATQDGAAQAPRERMRERIRERRRERREDRQP